jgi:Protein of unknown function (DUF2628)
VTEETVSKAQGNDPRAESDAVRRPRDERALLGMFIGPNAASYLFLFDARYWKETPSRWLGVWRPFNFVAGFFPAPWFFYRKLYLAGLACISIPAVIAVWSPEWAFRIIAGMTAPLIFAANTYYVTRVRTKIAEIERSGLPQEQRDARIRSAGGVCEVSGYVGIVLQAGLILLLYNTPGWMGARPKAMAVLPACDAPGVQQMVEKIMPAWGKRPGYVYADFKEVATPTASKRQCSFTLNTGALPVAHRFAIHWNDPEGTKAVLFMQGME